MMSSKQQSLSGFKGIRKVRNRWQGRIVIDGKRVCSLGFDTPQQAAQWRESQIEYARSKGKQVAA